MKSPEIPVDDQARLETLQSLNILDTSSEERFDCLARLAQRLFSVPIVHISLVDKHRQWFKSRLGHDICETPRDISFCGHTILNNEILVIPNALEDERFADNPLVLGEPRIRFYAGCPLKAPNGHKVGTLCILDRQPRQLEPNDLRLMRDLANIVEHEMAVIQLATQDELTIALNRRGFTLLAQHTLNLCIRQRISAALVYIDIDKFKSINDTFGHKEGDRVLMTLATQLQRLCRETDILARLGGDEFVLLLSDADKQQAEGVIARLHEALHQDDQAAQRGYGISFSHGIVEFDPQQPVAIATLLTQGDALMYRLKRAKRPPFAMKYLTG